jgi:anthranilate synthase/aminodeoxychorismate synthase-like glutamine amidotransferase
VIDLTVVDADDSFTWNLVQAFAALGARVEVVHTRAVTARALCTRRAVVLGPGPGAPAEAGVHVEAAGALIDARVPLLGVCLGMQAMGLALGGRVGRVGARHGHPSEVAHTGEGIFGGIPSPARFMRYHSLAILDDERFPAALAVVGRSEDGVVQAVHHRRAPAWGVQFHPESVGSVPWGNALLGAWLADAAREAPDRAQRHGGEPEKRGRT